MRHKDGTEQATQQVLVHEQDDQEVQHKGLGISYLIRSVYLNFTSNYESLVTLLHLQYVRVNQQQQQQLSSLSIIEQHH